MITLIDNYDSFTFNLVQYFGDLGETCRVIRNDQESAQAVINAKPKAIILSPGPCSPDQAGICMDVIRTDHDIPIFGVCLGFQSMAQAFGGHIIRAPQPVHGKTSPIKHQGRSVFRDLPSPYNVVRYHSLIAERETFPTELEVTAETEDGIIMGLQHKSRPVHGVLFHPESYATEHGHALIKNFLRIVL